MGKKLIVAPEMKEKEILQELTDFDIQKEAQAAVEKAGLTIPREAPILEDQCALPPDITAISFEELGKLHGSVVNMGCYVRTLAATNDIEREVADAKYDYLKSRAMQVLADPNEDKVTFTKARVISHPLVRKCQREVLLARSKYELFKRKLENYDAMAIALSREITRRNNELTQIGHGG